MPGQGNGEKDNALRAKIQKEFFGPGRVVRRIGDYIPSGAVVDEMFVEAGFDQVKVYLSGPMSGIEDFNFPAFAKAAEWLRGQGFSVFSPHDLGWGNGNPIDGTVTEDEYLEFMREDIRQVAGADMIVLLPGWEKSRGAKFELSVARWLGLKVQLYAEVGDHPTLVDEDPPVVESVLQEADRLVSHDRQSVYGHPFDDFTKVTDAAKALGIDPINGGPLHHALYMIIVKLARLTTSPGHHDSIVDIGGYAKTYDMVLQERLERLVGGTS